MQIIRIASSDTHELWSYSNGGAYELKAKDANGIEAASVFIPYGDDAVRFREEFENMAKLMNDDLAMRELWMMYS